MSIEPASSGYSAAVLRPQTKSGEVQFQNALASAGKASAASAALPPPPPPDPNAPAPAATGDVNYYRNRQADFLRRNPGMTPPAYYMEYGDKYAHRFAGLGPMELSPAGLAWRDRTLNALQEAIEKMRREDPAGFAALERDPDAFTAFAYASHPDAYVNSGLFTLSAQDLAVIAMTPDVKDVLSQDGMKGWWATMEKLRPQDVAYIAGATLADGEKGVARAVYVEAKKVLGGLHIPGPWDKLPSLW